MEENQMKKERNSNLELLRIFCILFIIGDHFTGQSGIAEGSRTLIRAFYCSTTSLSRVACSVFIIISAWFCVDKAFRFRKIVHVWLTVIMYTVPIMLYLLYVGEISRANLITALFPVEESPLWFAGYYIILLLLTPMLNLLLAKAPKHLIEYFIGLFFLLLVLYPTLTARLGFFYHDIWIMIFLYLLTGYIKKYRENIPSSDKCFALFLTLWATLTLLRSLSQGYSSRLMGLVGSYLETYRARLQTLPNLAMAYSLFFGFYGLKIKRSKVINTLASTTLGVYVYHQVPYWYTYMWQHIYHSDRYAQILHGGRRMLYTLCCIIMVWLIGVVLELVRDKIAAVLIENRQYCIRFCDRIDTMINNPDGDTLFDLRLFIGIVLAVGIYMILANTLTVLL